MGIDMGEPHFAVDERPFVPCVDPGHPGRHRRERERAHGLDALVYDVIPKPFSLGDLVAKVADALAGKPVEMPSLARQAAGEA